MAGRLPQAARRGGDAEDGATGGGARTKNLAEKIAALNEKRGRYQAMLAQLERTGEAPQISPTDPASRAMAAHTKVGVGYNVLAAVDAKNKLIVEQAVNNQVVDMGLLTEAPGSRPAKSWGRDDRRRRGSRLLQDRRHREPASRQCVPHAAAAAWYSSVREGLFRKDEFRYDAGLECLRLPGREVADADPPWPDARSRSNRLRQPESPPRLSAARAMHEQRPALFSASKTRTFSIVYERLKARPAILRPPRARSSQRPIRQHQAVDVSGRLPDARPRQRACAGAQPRRRLRRGFLRCALDILGVEAMTAAVAAWRQGYAASICAATPGVLGAYLRSRGQAVDEARQTL